VLYPLTFHPRFKERVWGGRALETLYRKALPPEVPIGESWEISDRPGDESIIANGPLGGRSLRWLMEQHGPDVLGRATPAAEGRFPLLCKILDARDVLSLQVHPPAGAAAALGGEPKTEMWYIADAAPDAELYAGLRRHITREAFEAAIRTGTVAECLHRVPVESGDAMFLPSGRVHAIGAGLVIFEIQQNSDTTYRVFDWNRPGLDGRPRALHVSESLACIDFEDVEPALVRTSPVSSGALTTERLVDDPLFATSLMRSNARATVQLGGPGLRIAAVVRRRLVVHGRDRSVELTAGQFCVIPASLEGVTLTFESGSQVLVVDVG
jgi:mannose-6-phosphate isomerase